VGRVIVVVFGLMGTGKTSRARALAAELGWPVIHSDLVRKSLAGMAPTTRAQVEFGKGIYAEDFSSRTYAAMRRLAAEHLVGGQSVILDGSFKRMAEREAVRQLAREHGAGVLWVYCECPAQAARERLGLRLTDPQAISDGRVELSDAQARDFDPLRPEDRPLLRLDTSRDPNVVQEELNNFVKNYLPEGDLDAT
jgi:uncharacterized protein